ncbi:8787_t:CDS:2, partial [Racocetra fulgida]
AFHEKKTLNIWNVKRENAIDIENLTTMIYETLISMDNTDESLENDYGFYFESITNLKIEKDQHEQYLANRIAKLVEQGDGYNYASRVKQFHKKQK